MQDRPSTNDLLVAVATFLTRDLQPLVAAQDRGLGYRVLIAGHLVQTVAAELAAEAAGDAARLARLEALLPEQTAGKDAQRAVLAAEAELCRRLLAGEAVPQAALDHIVATLRERLAVSSPRFDLADDIGEVD